MAANRMDAGKTEADSGESRLESAPVNESPQSAAAPAWQAWLPLLGAIVLMPALAYAVTNYILLPNMQKGLGLAPSASASSASAGAGHGAASAAAHDSAAGPKDQVPLSKLLVNVAGTMGSRFLMTSFTLVSTSAGFSAEVAKHEAQLRDTACGILSTKTIPDLEKPGARNIIRSELLSAFNGVLGGALVEEIYFTDFAIQ